MKGDILKVYKDSGELAVEYLYDAWGAIIDISVTTVAIGFGTFLSERM